MDRNSIINKFANSFFTHLMFVVNQRNTLIEQPDDFCLKQISGNTFEFIAGDPLKLKSIIDMEIK